jgi:hypothetical protein
MIRVLGQPMNPDPDRPTTPAPPTTPDLLTTPAPPTRLDPTIRDRMIRTRRMLTLTMRVDPTNRNFLRSLNGRMTPIRTILNGRSCRNVRKILKIPKIRSYRDAAQVKDRVLVQVMDPALAPVTVLELGRV